MMGMLAALASPTAKAPVQPDTTALPEPSAGEDIYEDMDNPDGGALYEAMENVRSPPVRDEESDDIYEPMSDVAPVVIDSGDIYEAMEDVAPVPTQDDDLYEPMDDVAPVVQEGGDIYEVMENVNAPLPPGYDNRNIKGVALADMVCRREREKKKRKKEKGEGKGIFSCYSSFFFFLSAFCTWFDSCPRANSTSPRTTAWPARATNEQFVAQMYEVLVVD
jgi:hypothetical protein